MGSTGRSGDSLGTDITFDSSGLSSDGKWRIRQERVTSGKRYRTSSYSYSIIRVSDITSVTDGASKVMFPTRKRAEDFVKTMLYNPDTLSRYRFVPSRRG